MPPRIPSPRSHTDQLAEVSLAARQELAAIQGYTEMIEEELGEGGDEVGDDLRRIREATLRLVELVASLEAEVANARDLAAADPLTGIANRRAFFERAEDDFQAPAPMSLLLFDVDRFKDINDQHGHVVGDEVLTAVVERCLRAVREGDRLARLSGDEFVLSLPGADLEVARAVADRLRRKVSDQPVATRAGLVSVSISMGVVERTDEPSLTQLVEAADEAMYREKRRR